ncbi:MAG: 16S rRNA (cytosine(1402)-N(4))-methyltransferase RsmH [Syntrophomonadaceae bacterium]|nr:16S rRNA (cytosine(1402)-N(4))-methyltransferase RsmH [Syntrophomonadaceae bacterium]
MNWDSREGWGPSHRPVLLEETVSLLVTGPGVYVDCTAGGGGHLALLAARAGAGSRLIAIDRDCAVLARTREQLQASLPQVMFVHGNFRDLGQILERAGVKEVQGVLMDLGVSSFQLDDAARGFSYRADAPLDMRMDTSQATSAADLVNRLSEQELSRILWEYGEERYARRIARSIVAMRQREPIVSTGQLVEAIRRALPAGQREGKHPARRSFQALRIAVNEELESLRAGLEAAVEVLAAGGRLAVISFHSLEDRMVKAFFAREAKGCLCPPELPVCVCGHRARLRVLTRRPVTPTPQEVAENPRARSARLRVAEKLAVYSTNGGGTGCRQPGI